MDLLSSKLSKLLRSSDEFFASILLRLSRSAGVVVSSLLSNDFRYAATFPVIIPESFNESFEPKLSARLLLWLLLLLLLFISNLVVDGGRSGVEFEFSFVGDPE